MVSLAHIVNPVNVPPSQPLHFAQMVTFASMRAAREFAAGEVDISLYSAQYPEDHSIVPAMLETTPDLVRSAFDLDFQPARKLPFISDILHRLYEASNAEYFIYTNVDIALQPAFYLAVCNYIERGYDAFVINRRTIPAVYSSIAELVDMYAEVGLPHRGWDCFIFRRDAVPKYDLSDVIIGAPRVGLALLANLVAFSGRFHEFADLHLTFHLGNDQNWRQSRYVHYAEYNAQEANRILERLEERAGRFSPGNPVGAFLQKRRRFGFIYDAAVRRVSVPLPLVRAMRSFLTWIRK